MRKEILLLFFIILILPCALAEIDIKPNSPQAVFIDELNQPAVFNIEITNTGNTETFEIYNLLGFKMDPTSIKLEKDKLTNLTLNVIPPVSFNYQGAYTLPYFFMKGNFEFEKQLLLRAVHLRDAFEIGAIGLNPEANSVELFVQNKEDFNFGKVNFKFSSAFFKDEQTFDISPKEKNSFIVKLDRDQFKKLTAGYYTIKTEISVGSVTTEKDSIIKFEEKDLLEESRNTYGFIIVTEVIKDLNKGNTVLPLHITIEKNIISRLFTSFNIEPTLVERQGAKIIYTWNSEVSPGEDFEVRVKTNWIFPFLVIFFVSVIILLTMRYSKTDVDLSKKVTFVRAHGGEFALKVSIYVRARKYVERVTLTDRLPPLVKLYEKFGREKPSRIDEVNKKISWEFEKLEAGEVRIINYIIYSKIGVMGKFALPSATAIYEREGKIKESESNRAFFLTEQKKDIE